MQGIQRLTFYIFGPIHNQLNRTVLNFITLQLQQKTAQSNQDFESWGPDAAYTARPWALVFVHDTQALSKAIKDETSLEERQWLESIRVCQVENVHQLQGILCALHIREHPQPRSDLLSWIQTERDNQPPCLIVVKDMLRWMDATNTRPAEHRYARRVLCIRIVR
ncbi:hypothetical protein BJV82DRAFT_508003 [Fennellomyces sp. T-0311]|nr:hypothetical protein BJV82DRAFT_508003 [Fennellomyces sp. T-0311]